MSLTSPHSVFGVGALDVNVLPTVSECTVAQAAKFLDVKEGYVNEMLAAGRVPFRQENGERLLDWDSLVNFAEERKRRHAALDEMVRWNQEMGLYDD
jgi:hypothetical protein